MARAVYGSIITELNGSVGGLTFQNSSSGKIARLRPTRTRKNSSAQLIPLNILSQLNNSYHLLSAVNKALWDDYALLYPKWTIYNIQKKLSGYNYYISVNYNLLTAGKTIVASPPTRDPAYAIPSFVLKRYNSKLYIYFSMSFYNSHSPFSIWFSKPMTSSNSKFNSKLYNIFILKIGTYQIIDITAAYENYFNLSGLIAETSNMFSLTCLIFSINRNSGMISSSRQANIIIDQINIGIGKFIISSTFIIY